MSFSNLRCSRFLRCPQSLRCPSDSAAPSAIKHQSNRQKHGNDVTDPSSIREAALKFIERFGDDAIHQANIRANELLLIGNYQGRTRWQLIGKEVEQLCKNVQIPEKNTVN